MFADAVEFVALRDSITLGMAWWTLVFLEGEIEAKNEQVEIGLY